ncbi:MFS transporter, FHS family, L-fucose permease [Hymenobacter daecheongensis DSM 21074]|uniref:MFS transporter, FHS family, L-fucose permease n=1 Tax=Hymenobacter daecheongensis DSM 21074 TaxID=1121955 RepID=A0A1M6HWW4_9BACT|nr:sugar MFS transporter [Hymenobacter daecheongensis]SHJ26736.1 MFS transporter, FHS family, L-fucose permease [Hymenobacter daecheongensis DSM 21074]
MAAPLASSSTPTALPAARSYAGPMVLMTTLFFLFGAVTNFNDVLMPYLKDVCQLTDLQSSAVQSAFFGAYFLMSLPAGWVLKKLGYQRGIVVGLLVMAGGALLFIPAADSRAFGLFLTALAVLGAGITLLQVAANPYVSVLGPARSAAARVSIVGVANNFGGSLSPLVGGLILFGGSVALKARLAALPLAQRLGEEAQLVKGPYMGLAAFLVLLAGVFFFLVKLPEIEGMDADEAPAAAAGTASLSQRTSALAFPHLVLGIVAIFVYVGVEVGLGSFLIRYGESQGIQQLSGFTQSLVRGLNVATNYALVLFGQEAAPIDTTAGFTKAVGAVLVSSYWFGSLVGRLVGIPLLLRFHNRALLVAVCAAGAALVGASLLSHGETALWLVVLCGLMNSIMWPVIFPLAITGLGQFTKQGSSYLIMAIVGGALIPPLMGFIATHGGGLQLAFVVPMLCYLYLLFYALSGYRVR